MEVNEIATMIVDFERYCKTCKHKDKKENESPCDECLDSPMNLQSAKPIRWEEK